jgi:hypothetical protein
MFLDLKYIIMKYCVSTLSTLSMVLFINISSSLECYIFMLDF